MNIDYEKLRVISTDNTNKIKNAIHSSAVLTPGLYTINNIITFISELKVNELALFINSINHWITNKKKVSTNKFKPGDIIEIECGLNYSSELSYRHWAIILEVDDKTVLCVPTTSSSEYLKKTSEKHNGLWCYVLVGTKDGFNHNCTALLNNMKTVCKKRIYEVHGNITNTDSGNKKFRSIKEKLVSHYFQKEILEYQSKVGELNEQIKHQKGTINDLHKVISRYKSKVNKK